LEKFVSNTGNIKRLTVAVLVNGKNESSVNDKGEKTITYIPRAQTDLDQIASLVKSAVGFNAERGDLVEVQNIKFESNTLFEDDEYFNDVMKRDLWEKIITYSLIGLALLFSFLIIKKLLNANVSQIFLQQPQPKPALAANKAPELAAEFAEEQEVPEDLYIKKLSPEAKAKLKAKDKMTDSVVKFAAESPEDASKLLRSWITQEQAE